MASEVSGVVELHGQPVQGAIVKLFLEATDQTEPTTGAVKTTDSSGQYVFTSHPDAIDGQVQVWHVSVRYFDSERYFAYSKPGVEADLTSTTLRVADTETFSLVDTESDTYEAVDVEQGGTVDIAQGGNLDVTTDITL